MDIKLLKHMARNSFALMLMVIVISIVISNDPQSTIYANSSENQMKNSGSRDQTDVTKKTSNLALAQDNIDDLTANPDAPVQSVDGNLGDKYLIIRKWKHSVDNITIEDLYMDRSIRLTITGLKEEIFDDTSLVRVNKGKEYIGIPEIQTAGLQQTSGKDNPKKPGSTKAAAIIPNPDQVSDPVKDFSIRYSTDESGTQYTATIEIQLDQIYAHVLYQDAENIYVDLKRPKDVYDRIIVVDPGHGGTDCGTYSQGEEYYEKDVNLSLVLYLKELLDTEDIKVYYTRTTDKTVYLNPRVNLANEVGADFFISVHCNANESSEPRGSEILYNELIPEDGIPSKKFAQICLEEIVGVTHKVNRGLTDGSDILIVQKAKMPTALIEVAFMSNHEDMNFLLKDENRKEIAKALDKAIERAYAELAP